MGFVKVTDTVAAVPPGERRAGGDDEVPRTSERDGQRPRIITECWLCEGTGKRLNLKTGNLNKCQACGPKKDDPHTKDLPMGTRLKAYTRTTTFIDVIEDKSNLETWHKRMVLIGCAMEPDLLTDVLATYEEMLTLEAMPVRDEEQEARFKSCKNWLNRRAESAAEVAGAKDKANKGTFLHGLSEIVDSGGELPALISFHDVIDMDAYKTATKGLLIRRMEQLHVLDEFQVAGTPDRVSEWAGEEPLVAPDGHVFEPNGGELIITDLKTGRVDYGQLKMAMQLSIYAHSKPYDWRTGIRSEAGPVNQKWGIIMHGSAGTGECDLYWADLEMGWDAVQIAREVRALRSKGRSALTLFA